MSGALGPATQTGARLKKVRKQYIYFADFHFSPQTGGDLRRHRGDGETTKGSRVEKVEGSKSGVDQGLQTGGGGGVWVHACFQVSMWGCVWLIALLRSLVLLILVSCTS